MTKRQNVLGELTYLRLAYDDLRLDEFHAMFERRRTSTGMANPIRVAGAVRVVADPETMAVVVAMEKKRGAIHDVLRGRR